jgi:hypothetical protein
MVRIEGKRNTLILFLIFVWLPAIVLFSLRGTGNFGDYIQAGFYITVTFIKSDDGYYQNLNLFYLILSVVVGLIMTALSWGLSLNLIPEALTLGYTLSFIATPSSVSTIFLSLLLFGLVMAATSEELLKLTMFAELKERYGSRWYGVFLYVGFPVGFWALLHGIQAYSNPLLIVPAFINGVVLLVLLWRTKCILSCVLSHWLYNAGITLLSFMNGSADVPLGTPLLPDLFSLSVADVAVVMILVGSMLFFLVPALKSDR